MTSRWKISMAAFAVTALAVVFLIWLGRDDDRGPADLRFDRDPRGETTVSPETRRIAAASVAFEQPPTPKAPPARTREEWYGLTDAAKDYVQTVRDAAAAAEQGDDGAARELTVISARCILMVNAIRKGESKQSYLAALPMSSSTPYVTHMARIFDQCAPLATAPEFADWNAASPTGKFNAGYWRKVALELRNPPTIAENIGRELANAPDGSFERQALLDRVREEAREVLRLRDGEAWNLLGMRLGNSDLSKDISLGFALVIASCDMGYDCSAANERNKLNQCEWFGGCTGSEDVRQRLESMSPDLYAKSYARYQELKDLISRGRWDEIDRFAPIDGTVSQ